MSKTSWIAGLLSGAALVMGGCPAGPQYIDGPEQVALETSKGRIVVELYPEFAPATVANFLQYVDDGFYVGTLVHRVVPGFVIQGGGLISTLLPAEPTRDAISPEATGLLNVRGAVALRVNGDGLTAGGFYVNLADNPQLDTSGGGPVFGTVASGLEVLDAIAALPTTDNGVTGTAPTPEVRIVQVTTEPGDTPALRFVTTLGDFVVALDEDAAAASAALVRGLAGDGYYDGTVFDGSESGVRLLTGEYFRGLDTKPTRDPIVNESFNGLSNVRGTIAMARGDDPNSATSQFFINLADNTILDPTLQTPGYTVFGQVVEGLGVVDEIGRVDTQTRGGQSGVPIEDIEITSATRLPVEQVLSPEWEAFLAQWGFQAANAGRGFVVDILGALITSIGT